MIKKIIFTIILCCLIFSCGKKGDPVYKDTEKKVKMRVILMNKA
tara:strand:+ start:229 stop:360 length:132 start_codon:yes stop_codon:yes gene_type:complete